MTLTPAGPRSTPSRWCGEHRGRRTRTGQVGDDIVVLVANETAAGAVGVVSAVVVRGAGHRRAPRCGRRTGSATGGGRRRVRHPFRAVTQAGRTTFPGMTASPASLNVLRGLLDEGLLSGQLEVTTVLRPQRLARPVAADDIEGTIREIEWACQMWGGGAHPLLPVSDRAMPEPYLSLVQREQIDYVRGLQETEVRLPDGVDALGGWEHPVILLLANEPRDDWRSTEVVELKIDDPSRPIYVATLGTWPTAPESALLERYCILPDLAFGDVLPIRRVEARGSVDDLVARATSIDSLCPRTVANMFLAHGLQPDSSFMGTVDGALPIPSAVRRAAGPNIIVAISPGSVDDLTLLRNLRGAHGPGRALPIGLPVGEVTPDTLRKLQTPGIATPFGLSGGPCFLVSASVPVRELELVAIEAPPVKAVAYGELLTVGPAPGRHRSHVSDWPLTGLQGGRGSRLFRNRTKMCSAPRELSERPRCCSMFVCTTTRCRRIRR